MEAQMVRDMAVAQLRMIEASYRIRIQNLGEIADRIAASVDDPRNVLPVTTALNSYVARSNPREAIRIPEPAIQAAIAASRFPGRSGA